MDWHAATRGAGRAWNTLHDWQSLDWLNAIMYEDFRQLCAREEHSGGWRDGDGMTDYVGEGTCLEWQRPTVRKGGE